MDEAAFREFYALTARPVKSYLARITGSATLAEDFLQESYLRLLRSDAPLEDFTQRKNYLYRIATNLVRDHFRAAKNHPLPLQDQALGEGVSESVQVSSDVQKVLGEIKPNERTLMWLAYVEGASHREIATITGLRENSIRPLLFRVRQKLASLLRERGFQPPEVR